MINTNFHNICGPFTVDVLSKIINAKIYNADDGKLINGAADVDNAKKGDITFIKKWGFSHKFFKKYYLRSKSLYIEPLKEPDKNLFYYFDLFLCKLKIIFLIFLTRR